MNSRSDTRSEKKAVMTKNQRHGGHSEESRTSPSTFLSGNLINVALVFLSALFFIITITSPALFINDEWITANQLHQLDIGHQVVINEAKYGATANGTISAYFTARGNILLYSLALPVISVPAVKIFGFFSDNFRLAVILIWSMIPVFAAFLFETAYPKCRKLWGIRLSVIALLAGVLLFCINIILYKQFPYSAPDAPYEVAALVMTNHLLFALIAAAVFESGRLIFRDLRLALFSTFACISCSSFIVWSGTAKDHVLTSAVFALVILFLIRYLYTGNWWNATAAFLFAGFLIWVRPEVGIVVSGMLFFFFIADIFWNVRRNSMTVRQGLVSALASAGIAAGAIPFFFNNLLLTGNFLTPVWVAPRPAIPIMNTTQQVAEIVGSGAISASPVMHSLAPVSTITGVLQSRFLSISPDTFGHLAQILSFPQNQGFGFLLICPLVPIALIAGALWLSAIKSIQRTDRKIFFFLIVMSAAVFCSYIPEMGLLNTDAGTPPDMRYLIPAYISTGLLSLMILKRTPYLTNPHRLVMSAFFGSAILVPAFIVFMIITHPFGVHYEGYSEFFKFLTLTGIALNIIGMGIFRFISPSTFKADIILPLLLILPIIAVLAFQVMLAFVVGDTIKFNGYPLWIPFIRESHDMIFTITTPETV